VVQIAFNKFHAARQSWPRACERLVQLCARGRQLPIRHNCPGRGIVKKDHDLRQQTVAAGKVDNPTSTKQAPHAPRDFPRFVQLFARETSGVAHDARKRVEQCAAGESVEVAVGQARA
jgi:hypothetical protein